MDCACRTLIVRLSANPLPDQDLTFPIAAFDRQLFLGREFGEPDGSLITELLPELPIGRAIAKVRGKPSSLLRVASASVRALPSLSEIGRRMCLQLGKTRKEIDEEIARRLATFSPAETSRPTKTKRAPSVHKDKSSLPEGYEKT